MFQGGHPLKNISMLLKYCFVIAEHIQTIEQGSALRHEVSFNV